MIKSKVYFPFGLTFLEGCLENLNLKPKFNLKLIISIFPTPPPASQIAFTEISHKIKLYDNIFSCNVNSRNLKFSNNLRTCMIVFFTKVCLLSDKDKVSSLKFYHLKLTLEKMFDITKTEYS